MTRFLKLDPILPCFDNFFFSVHSYHSYQILKTSLPDYNKLAYQILNALVSFFGSAITFFRHSSQIFLNKPARFSSLATLLFGHNNIFVKCTYQVLRFSYHIVRAQLPDFLNAPVRFYVSDATLFGYNYKISRMHTPSFSTTTLFGHSRQIFRMHLPGSTVQLLYLFIYN